MSKERHVFITGYPGFIARRLLRRLLAADDGLRVTALVEASRLAQAQEDLRELDRQCAAGISGRVLLVTGDVTAMDLGLSGPEFREIVNEATDIFHLAAVHRLGVDRPSATRVNVLGTQNVLDMALSMRALRRFVHFSSAYVSGRREGVVMEDELDCGQVFRNPYEATKFEAEKRVLAASRELPITIIRPPAVVGDSKSGEIDRFDGVYHIGLLLAASPVPMSFPLPGQGSAPLHLIPVDYLVDAVHVITEQPDTVGKTFHVVDPNPLSVERVFSRVAGAAGRRNPRYGVSTTLTKALLRIPGLERIAPVSHQVVDYLNHMAFYNSKNTMSTLFGTGVRCPSFDTYVDNLVRYARDYWSRGGRRDSELPGRARSSAPPS